MDEVYFIFRALVQEILKLYFNPLKLIKTNGEICIENRKHAHTRVVFMKLTSIHTVFYGMQNSDFALIEWKSCSRSRCTKNKTYCSSQKQKSLWRMCNGLCKKWYLYLPFRSVSLNICQVVWEREQSLIFDGISRSEKWSQTWSLVVKGMNNWWKPRIHSTFLTLVKASSSFHISNLSGNLEFISHLEP